MTSAAADGAGPVRPRPSLRRVLIVALIGASLLSVLALGLFNYVVARSLLTDAVEAQLDNHQGGQVRAIQAGLTRLTDLASTVARDQGTVQALEAFSGAYRDLQGRSDLLAPAELAALQEFYEQTDVEGAAAIDLPPGEQLLPRDDAGRYLQYHYVATNPFPEDRRDELTSVPADTTAYGDAHAEAHERIAELLVGFGFGDLMLIDDRGNVVYSTDKRIDFATDVAAGPYRDSGLADAVAQRLPRAAVNEAVLVDFEPYLPAGGRPVMFAAATVSDGADVIGAVVLEIPVELLNVVTTSQRGWERTGLGETGETYVVGSDRLLRSDSRLWLENPEGYLDALDAAGYPPELGASIAAADTTVLLQPASTEPVNEAFDSQRFVGRNANYLDQRTLTVAGPLAFGDLEWVVVADLGAAEANAALASLQRGLLVLALILVAAVAGVGVLLADRIARPVQPVVTAAAAVAGGDLDTPVTDLGRTEIGDIGRRLNTLTDDLRAQRDAKAAEQSEITELLLSVLPARLVDRLQAGDVEVADLTDTATVVAMTVHGPFDSVGLSPDTALEFSARLSRALEDTAERLGVERVRSASDHHVFAAGLGAADVAADDAASFVAEVGVALSEFEHETGVAVGYHAGLCAGEVVAGLLHRETFTYGVFGEPTRTALALDAVAADGQILVHESVAARLGPQWVLEPADGLVDLRGDAVEALLLTGSRTPDPQAAASV